MIKIEDKRGNIIRMDADGITLDPYNDIVKIIGNLIVTGDATAYADDQGMTAVSLTGHVHAQPADYGGDQEQDTYGPKRAAI